MSEDSGARKRPAFALPDELDSRWELVERICSSSHLRRSAKLRDLLIYLCHRSWSEGVVEIREHEIGVDVFQRPADYDSAQDTLVRVQASQLRKRLERYFAEEGREEVLVLEIAKATYEPVLSERPSDAPPLPLDLPLTQDPSQPNWTVRLLTVACVALACLSLWLATHQPATPTTGAGLTRFWSAFAPEGQDTTIVLADGAFSAIQDILHRPIQLDEYVRRGYRTELDRAEHSADKKEILRYLMERRYTSLADAMLLKKLWTAGVLDPVRTSILYSRDLHLRSLQQGNHILVGSRRAVPWVDLFDASLDFHFVYDEQTQTVRVENRHPQSGEPASFTIPQSDKISGDRFSIVASLPNAGNNGNVLILSGQEMSGTEAAANLITTENRIQEVLAKLPQTAGKMPHFEALLRVKHVEFTMQGFEVLAVHPH